jgi:hypothetical protein
MFDPHPACRKKGRQGEAGLGSATLYLDDVPGSMSATPRPASLLAGPILRALNTRTHELTVAAPSSTDRLSLSMATHVQQHYVPKFLLERWHSGSDGKLTALRWAHGRLDAQRYKAKSVARLAHLYSFVRNNGELDVAIERDFLGPHIDEPAANVHQSLLQTGLKLTDLQHEYWTRFLVSLLFRGPAMMEYLKVVGRGSLVDSLSANPSEFEEIRGDAKEASLLEWFQAKEPALLETFGTRMLPELIQQEKFRDRFLRGKVWMLRGMAEARHDLLIGDRPLMQDGSLDGDHAFVMPIAPRVLFIVASNERTAGIFRETPANEVVAKVNLMSIQRAETWVFATSPAQASYVRKHLPPRT